LPVKKQSLLFKILTIRYNQSVMNIEAIIEEHAHHFLQGLKAEPGKQGTQ